LSSATSILKQYWGYDSFRPGQAEIIDSILSGKDTLAILPTGGGKSICYQVPALLRPGLCLVISPLIALMRDQVENLRKRGITAYAIHTGMSRGEVINILTVAGESNCKLLYVSPERLNTALFKEFYLDSTFNSLRSMKRIAFLNGDTISDPLTCALPNCAHNYPMPPS